ncbi:hypothetical protein Bca52824_091422 [Brassica carinata]|uniref:Uncharacterized protein n=1 Tax=Brassica carinata TaxID=52824 RepID=A0A8X7NUF1_BRACI|nr:hypothetical protein Bca52824_091422 [Brassica carinata]
MNTLAISRQQPSQSPEKRALSSNNDPLRNGGRGVDGYRFDPSQAGSIGTRFRLRDVMKMFILVVGPLQLVFLSLDPGLPIPKEASSADSTT